MVNLAEGGQKYTLARNKSRAGHESSEHMRKDKRMHRLEMRSKKGV